MQTPKLVILSQRRRIFPSITERMGKQILRFAQDDILQRQVMAVDERNVVRYSESVPMSQLPNFTAALTAARWVLGLRAS